jgi:hypothetical protein
LNFKQGSSPAINRFLMMASYAVTFLILRVAYVLAYCFNVALLRTCLYSTSMQCLVALMGHSVYDQGFSRLQQRCNSIWT